MRVTAELKLSQEQEAYMEEDLDTELDLIKATRADNDTIRNLVEKKMQSKRFTDTHGVWNCVGGILIMPYKTIPKDIDDVEGRVSLWNPTESSIVDLWSQPADSAAVQGECAKNQGSSRMIYAWETELVKRTVGDMATAGDAVRKLCVFITAGPITKLCAWGRRIVEDMCCV